MATSLSNETSSASLVELSQTSQLPGSSNVNSSNYGQSSKPVNSDAKVTYTGSQNSNSQSSNCGAGSSAAANSSNYSGVQTSGYGKTKNGDTLYSSNTPSYGTQSSNMIPSSATIGYPFFCHNQYFSSMAQSQTSTQFNNYSSSSIGQSSMQSNAGTQSTQASRRAGKKKALPIQQQNPETRLFFHLRRQETQAQQNRGSSHFYKPKNPPSLNEWFKKLSIEERVNAMSTVNPHLIENFQIMHQKIDTSGLSFFALREKQNYMGDYKSYNSATSQQQYQLFQYQNFSQIISSDNGEDTLLFDKQFYHRVQSEYEIDKDLVQDAELFFKLMGYATESLAFSNPSQFFYDNKNLQNLIEYPGWFKPKSFQSFATWVIVTLEENIWAHYNYDNNTNLGNAKLNELSGLFREKTERGAQDVDIAKLSNFWRDMPENEKKNLISNLQINSLKEIEQYESNLSQSGGGYSTKTSKSGTSKNMHMQMLIKEKKEQNDKSSLQQQLEQELQYYIDMSQREGYEQEMMDTLTFMKFENTHHRQVLICKTYLDLIKRKYKDDLMENLLLEESAKQNKNINQSAQGQGKKKKKKNAAANQQQQSNQNQSDKQLGNQDTVDVQNLSIDYQEDNNQRPQMPVAKANKKKVKNSTDQSSNANEGFNKQVSSNNSGIYNEQSTANFNSGQQNNRKKNKKNNQNNMKTQQYPDQDNQVNVSINQDSHSCDEQQTNTDSQTIELESNVKCSSLGLKSSSNIYDNTTAHQSNNSNSNSSATITSTIQNNAESILQIQSSKSLDVKPTNPHKQQQSNTGYKQQKAVSKIESKNFQILQGQNSENDKRSKGEKKIKQTNIHNIHQDNVIFSEDDRQSKKLFNTKEQVLTSESENDSMEVIFKYVKELTDDMINKVCLLSERTNSKSSTREELNINNEKSYEPPEYYKLGAVQPTHYNQRKKSFYKNKNNNRKQNNQHNYANEPYHSNSNQIEHYHHNNNSHHNHGNQAYQYTSSGGSNLNSASGNNSQQQSYGDKRKISFNNSKKCFKDDKKFSEDFAENISNTSYSKNHSIQSIPDSNSNQILEDSYHDRKDNNQTDQINNKLMNNAQNKSQRKGFGINLKQQESKQEEKSIQKQPQSNHQYEDSRNVKNNQQQESEPHQAWAKGTAKQPDPVKQNKNKDNHHNKNQHKNANIDNQNSNQNQDINYQNSKSNQKTDQSDNITNDDEQSQSESQQNKKGRRNRKKKQMNNIDIMNSFMRNLQASQDEVKLALEQKTQGQFKKKPQNNGGANTANANSSHYQKVNHNKNQNTDTQSEKTSNTQKIEHSYQSQPQQHNPEQRNNQTKQQNQYKQKPQKQNLNQSNVTSSSVNTQVSAPIILLQKPKDNSQKQYSEHRPSIDTNDPDSQLNSSSNTQNQNRQNHQHKYNNSSQNNHRTNNKNYSNGQKSVTKFQKHQSHNQKLIERQNDELESIQSNKADCISDKSSKSFNEKVLSSETLNNLNQKAPPFKQLKFFQNKDFDNNSLTDATVTSNTAADTSLENCINHIEECKDPINIQDQESHIQISLTDSIDAQNLLKNNTFAYTFQQFSTKLIESTKQQTLQEIKDAATIPPILQSPQSLQNIQSNVFTPQYMQINQMNQFNQTISNFDFNEKIPSQNTGYQSFSNTPQKGQMNPQKNPFKPQTIPLSSQMSQNSQESGQNYRTPPQISKKTSNQYNYSNNGTYRKSHGNNTQQNQTQKSYQVKEYYQPQPKQSQGYIQPIPVQQMIQEPQFIHQYQDPNMMYYQDQSNYMSQNPLMDAFTQRPQEQIFQYVEKSAPQNMNIPQQIPYYQPNPMIQNFSPILMPQQDQINMPFNYNKRQYSYNQYDQGSDLIMQICNSIKFNQQSLSPIPHIINSPPPLIDQYSMNQNFDGSQMPLRMDSDALQITENAFYEQFDKEIEAHTKSISSNLELLKPERDFVYNKILKISQEVYVGQKPELQMFGSLITGLALESSDMDLAVIGLLIDDRQSLIWELNKLANQLQTWQCLESFKSIETASIPKIDLIRLREQEMASIIGIDFESRPINEELRYLSVDITFDDSSSSQNLNAMSQNYFTDIMGTMNNTKTHLGLQSCSLVQYYIANYQNLKEVSILLKKFLAIHKFNSPYYGGISSYSTVILLVAYMNYFGLRGNHNLSSSRLLMGFLDFYGNYFNPSSWGINVNNESMLDSNIVILDPLNLSNNTTRNSYLTKDILLKFQYKGSPLIKNYQNSGITNQNFWQYGHDFEVQKSQEEIEASNLMNSEKVLSQMTESVNELPPFSQVNLLETFFASETQPIIAISRESSSQQEPINLSLGTSQSSVGINGMV
ncbi:UNKNOWN [Stylonychia lemnae]|uniref:Polymerase nucleotidyl transferase domain-containing protein n=1 Tax=Stylonychia lemnae TaxID=5949 RepID=A0A078B0J9_STYLE|nr:UNKNOWN [Stylonychia lemnae]|eukprot:CDW86887.1 UNKNOWN [Stylonychia lemnae]